MQQILINSAVGAGAVYLLGGGETIAVQTGIGSMAIYALVAERLKGKKLGEDRLFFFAGVMAPTLAYMGAMAFNGQFEQMNLVIAGAASAAAYGAMLFANRDHIQRRN